MNHHRNWIRALARWALVAAVLVIGPSAGGSGRRSSPVVLGAYRLEFRGALSGTGNATVSAQAVIMSALLRDEQGSAGNLTAQNLPLNGGRFFGTGTYKGLPIRISGRVDPPGDALTTARLVCIIDTSSTTYARALGIKR